LRHCGSGDEKIALAASEILLSRGYGKPEIKADIETTHKFAVVPDVMPRDEWLARHGQPVEAPDYKPPKPCDPSTRMLDLKVGPEPNDKPN
jgi:hypothetical protein